MDKNIEDTKGVKEKEQKIFYKTWTPQWCIQVLPNGSCSTSGTRRRVPVKRHEHHMILNIAAYYI